MTYSTFPVNVEYAYLDETDLPFPGITICNVNKYRKSQLNRPSIPSSNLTQEEEERLKGHQIEDMILTCRYKFMTCSAAHFLYVHDKVGNGGNCYTFNSVRFPIKAINDLVTGRDSALEMVLATEQGDYEDSTVAAGFIIQIHDGAQFPTPESKTVSVSAGYSTYIALELVSNWAYCRSNRLNLIM